MAGFLRYSNILKNNCDISFMVVGPGNICNKISQGLYQSAKNRRLIAVHQCEFIADTFYPEIEIGVDFIIFAFDWRITQSLSEVEINLRQVDEHYLISGCACLINCSGIPNVVGQTSLTVKRIRDKYNIQFLTAKTKAFKDCASLGNRILNIAEAKLGLISGIPEVPILLQYN